MTAVIDTQIDEVLFGDLTAIVGEDHVLTDSESCSFYAQDVFTKDQPTMAVVQPENKEELSAAIKAATQAGCDVIPRGGGVSYTSAYVPVTKKVVTFDLSRMNRILDINTKDMTVTVECGCTWQKLYETLSETGFRTPYWGTLSGSVATIGGGLSQNSIFWGSGQHGTAADSVIGLEVVLADGSVIKTGSGAQINSTPFFRHYGPDLTGIFTCDSGALGFKATATLRLMKAVEAKQFCAFDFKTGEEALAAMSEISRQGLASECFGFDPVLQAQRMARAALSADVKALAGVMKSSGSMLGALKDGAKVALAGRRYMDDVDYSIQIMIEDTTQKGADLKARKICEIAASLNGREIENSIPKIARANPFGPLNNMLGASGERWIPTHGLVAHSNAEACYQEILAIFERHKEAIEKYKIQAGFLFAVISTNCTVLEPVFFWPDAATEIHTANVEASHYAKLTHYPENLEARGFVANLRKEISLMFKERGGVHLQIGKDYHYSDGIDPVSFALVKSIKHAVDPNNQVNPGALGFNK